jgi:hypothetical protein
LDPLIPGLWSWSQECKAEEIDVAAYATAEADGLAEFAPELVSYMNGCAFVWVLTAQLRLFHYVRSVSIG